MVLYCLVYYPILSYPILVIPHYISYQRVQYNTIQVSTACTEAYIIGTIEALHVFEISGPQTNVIDWKGGDSQAEVWYGMVWYGLTLLYLGNMDIKKRFPCASIERYNRANSRPDDTNVLPLFPRYVCMYVCVQPI